jgi:thiamine biosynthesis lipoprotein
MAELLEEWGLQAALVHGGFSSVLALEAPPGQDGWPLSLSDPGAPSHVLARPLARRTGLGASGIRKGDHVVDPRTGEPARGRRAAWVAVPRPEVIGGPAEEAPRLAAVADALATAFMVMSPEETADMCARSPGLEAWLLPDAAAGPRERIGLLHVGGSTG